MSGRRLFERWEDEFIRRHAADMSSAEMGRCLDRDADVIRYRAARLDISLTFSKGGATLGSKHEKKQQPTDNGAVFPSFAGQDVPVRSTGIYHRPKAVSHIPTEANS